MKDQDQKDIGMFGFRRSHVRKSRAARALFIVSLAVVAIAVWFVVFRH